MADQVELRVPAELDGERVDKVLANLLGVSRAEARSLVERGTRVDGVPAEAADRVEAGQLVTSPRPAPPEALKPEPVPFDVLYEDDLVLVVNKPAGVVVHPGAGNRSGTLAAGLLERYPNQARVGDGNRAGLVHRLDKDTSGAILVARTEASLEALAAALRARDVDRAYLTLVEGVMQAPTGTVEAPIGRDPARPTRRIVTHGGKHARTHYRLVEAFEEAGVSLLEVRLETGRTHQIRVHLASIGHPVIADRVYGSARLDLPRMFLHAARVSFPHPSSGDVTTVEAPLAPDLQGAVEALRARSGP